MTIYYKDGFYDNSNGGFVPEGAVEISLEQYARLLEGQAQGKLIITDSKGNPQLREPPPTAHHTWNEQTQQWDISPENLTTLLQAKKTALINQISAKSDQLKSLVFAGYSTAEVESFYRQEKEALALKDDPTYPALMLNGIANSRGVPLEILAQKVLEKADFAAPIIGSILGKKQQFEDRIQAVENFADFANLEEEIEQWQL